ncbi:MAG TPA: histidine kinase dimerization/phospho-acceptor domain-containing protein, partial [Devosia sp.]|nr:histidine kinase dimerization/phospho-acceptor domain-containing protein [Devosia sp.]
MQAAELSGVTGNGGAWSGFGARQAGATRSAAKPEWRVSRITLAVGATALAAALLFVATDLIRSIAEARFLASLAALDEGAVWAGIAQRAAVALGLALVATGLAFRRRSVTAAGEASAAAEIAELIDTLPVGVALWSARAELVACNDRFRMRLDGAIAAAATYHDAVAVLVRGGHMELVLDSQCNRIIELHGENGSCLMVDERPLASGGFITLVTDITEHKRTDLLLSAVQEEQRLLARRYHAEKLRAEAASRAKTSFLAHLSHDIRTPLNHIIGFADMIRHETWGPLGDARYLDYIETIKSSGEKLLASFTSILELVQFESGGRPLEMAVVDVDEVTRTVIRRFSAQAGKAGLVLALGAPAHAKV